MYIHLCMNIVFALQHDVHNLPGGREEDAGHQATIPGDDHQEPEEVLHVRGAGAR